jgi:hypothetical protein
LKHRNLSLTVEIIFLKKHCDWKRGFAEEQGTTTSGVQK